jgi:BirA family biotin operon repressor/biotin-[acetyl-CoA-carboxylase] ligase
MRHARALLGLLGDGQIHPAVDLARRGGLSPSAVRRDLAWLRAAGVDISAVRGRGYRLDRPLALLDAERIEAGLAPRARRRLAGLEVLDAVDSTNRRLLERAPGADEVPFVCLAELQTAGRGRRGRGWHSPFGRNLYLSVHDRLSGSPLALDGLSLAVGVAVADALEVAGVSEVRLKWPNDLFAPGPGPGGKLGGVLVETSFTGRGEADLVVGVGINVDMPAGSHAAIDRAWTDLRGVVGRDLDRSDLAAGVAGAVVLALADFAVEGFIPFRERWIRRDALAGRAVVVDVGGRRLAGTARGVDERGALLIDTESGRECVNSGTVLEGAP